MAENQTCVYLRCVSPPYPVTDSLTRSLCSRVTPGPPELHFLFSPTRKSPRQGTPPPRHRRQQQREQGRNCGTTRYRELPKSAESARRLTKPPRSSAGLSRRERSGLWCACAVTRWSNVNELRKSVQNSAFLFFLFFSFSFLKYFVDNKRFITSSDFTLYITNFTRQSHFKQISCECPKNALVSQIQE